MQTDQTAITTDLVLVGGGHSHLFVLKSFAMQPVAGLRLTLITRDLHTPYSGMLPGYIAGHYQFDEAHIDLRPLAALAGARIIHQSVLSINADQKQVILEGRPAIDYDLLSINIGSTPAQPDHPLSLDNQAGIKPIDQFIEFWRTIEQRLETANEPVKLAIIGAGAGGVELALSLQFRASRLATATTTLELILVSDGAGILPSHSKQVQTVFDQILRQRGIRVEYSSRVTAFDGEQLSGEFDDPIPAHAVIWATQASAAKWLQGSGLQLDEQGFIALNPCLQSLSHGDVFAAGDIASVARYPRVKSGVFAVRQGLPLAQNLRRKINSISLKPYVPQRQFLSLISSGEQYAIASRGRWMLQGKWCWQLKDWIDRRFIKNFSELPAMSAEDNSNGTASVPASMRCGGCGSKLGSDLLHEVLEKIMRESDSAITLDLKKGEDAAVLQVPAGMQLLQSVDSFRRFIDDPYLFGRIATNHALGDMHAMGVEADSVLVIATVPIGQERKQRQDLYQLMSGIVASLSENGTRLLGGHSSEAIEMSCGLSVNGFADQASLLLKSGMQPGDLLILSKGLGSGVLFAADMQGKARGQWIDDALVQMLQSSKSAADCLNRHGANACTDVTGFGLAGHLLEMLDASDCAAELYTGQIPFYAGAIECSSAKIKSSLYDANSRVSRRIEVSPAMSELYYPLLFDPQTAGGLLASVAPARAGACLQNLHKLGYDQAQIIGRVIERSDEQEVIYLKR
ncbi:MAG: selenide,water dikinase [Gammaproteobacteria bacterium]|jgi:selenide,water dikinase